MKDRDPILFLHVSTDGRSASRASRDNDTGIRLADVDLVVTGSEV